MDKVYAEDVNYWKSGTSSPDTILENAKKEIRSVGGVVRGELFGSDEGGKSMYMLAFSIDADNYRIQFPVLESRTKNTLAARRQAVTALYHDIKAKCVMMKFMGARTAFLPYLVLEDGRTASQATGELSILLPQTLMLTADGS